MRALYVAALAALALVAATAGRAEEEGKDRWPVKTAPPAPGSAQVVPVATLIGLADVPGVGHNDARFQLARIPGALNGLAEGATVTTTGWLHLVAFEDDGDFHMQISADPVQGSPCLIVEVPDPKYVSDPTLKAQATAVRAWVVAKVFAGKTPSAGGSVLKHPVKVTVSGALFFDDSHVADVPRGKKGMKAGTLWELHPVTAIGFAP